MRRKPDGTRDLSMHFINLTGKRFGKWKVLSLVFVDSGRHRWECLCDCGTKRDVLGSTLRNRRSSGCGCDRAEKIIKSATSHGMSKSREYGIWAKMLARCRNENHASYRDYGGRGIAPCAGCLDFETFYAAVGQSLTPKHSLERIDNDSGYWCGECEECKSIGRNKNMRWATKSEQNRNKQDTHRITFNGETKCLAEWARVLGFKTSTLTARFKLGWTIDDALQIPVGTKSKLIKISGAEKEELIRRMRSGEHPTKDMASEYGVTVNGLYSLAWREQIKFQRETT